MADRNGYDVAVLGSGPGGYVAAIRASQLGLKAVLVEKDPWFGGTCLHLGCIPTKTLLYTAELLDKLKHSKELGILIGEPRLDWQALQKRKERLVRKLATGISYLFKKNGVETRRGFGSIVGEGKLNVRVGDEVKMIDADNILIATGSEPRALPGVEIDGRNIITSREILSLPEQPKTLAVIGAGAVGVEFASMFASFGTEVSLIEILPRVLPQEDEEISLALARFLRKRGIEVLTETRLDSVETHDEAVEIRFTMRHGRSEARTFEKLLVAVGRKPRTEGIGLEAVGIETVEGMIPVDDFMKVVGGAEGFYAIGDVVASPQLAHVASAEGILAVEKLAGLDTGPVNYDRMPSCTYCSPEVASVGLTESRAKAKGFEVKVGRFPFSANSKASILGDQDGLVKVISEARYDEVLGVHIIGPHATNMIAEACVALEHEATADSLMRVVHPHPTLSEAIKEASHGAALGHAIHF